MFFYNIIKYIKKIKDINLIIGSPIKLKNFF